jgi:hypothetical protein
MYVMTMLGLDMVTFPNDTTMVRHFWYSDGIGTDNFNPGIIDWGATEMSGSEAVTA